MKQFTLVLVATVAASLAPPAHAQLRTWRITGTVFQIIREPNTPSLLPVPDPTVGDSYQLDIVYDTKTHGFNTFEACTEYAAVKSVTLTVGEHSANLSGPASTGFADSRGWITVCNDSVDYRGDTLFIQTVGVFSVVVDLRGRSDLFDNTELPSVPPMEFPSRTFYTFSPTRSFGSINDSDAFFGSITSIVALKKKVKEP